MSMFERTEHCTDINYYSLNSLSVTADRSVVFSGYFDFLHQ